MINYRNQRGFSILWLLVAVVVIFLVILFGQIGQSSKKQNIENKQTDTNDEQQKGEVTGSLKIIETDKYVFAYPQNYVKFNSEAVKGTELAYKDPKSDRAQAAMIYLLVKTDWKKPLYSEFGKAMLLDDCREDREQQLQSTKEKIIEVQVSNAENYKGCYSMTRTPVDNFDDAVIEIHKYLVPTNRDDVSYYMVRGVFFESDNQTNKNLVELAVKNFKIK